MSNSYVVTFLATIFMIVFVLGGHHKWLVYRFKKQAFETKLNLYWESTTRFYVIVYSAFLFCLINFIALISYLFSPFTINSWALACLLTALFFIHVLTGRYDGFIIKHMGKEELRQNAHHTVFEAMIYLNTKRELYLKEMRSDLLSCLVSLSLVAIFAAYFDFWAGWAITGGILMAGSTWATFQAFHKAKKAKVKADFPGLAVWVSQVIATFGFIILMPVALALILTNIDERVNQDSMQGQWE